MAWISLHQAVWTHRKTYALAECLELSETYAAAHVIRLWTWALDNAPEGRIDGVSPRGLARAADWGGEPSQFVAALIECGWLDRTEDDGYAIHDWEEYAGKLIDRRRTDAERLRRWRDSKKSETGPTETDETRTKRERNDRQDAVTLPDSTGQNSTGPETGGSARATAADAAPPDPKPPIQAIPKTRELPTELVELRSAFESRGLRAPPLTASAEFQAARRLLKRAREPDELAACWQDVRAGDWGDDWDQRNLSMVMLERNDRFGNWQAWKGGEVGTPKRNNGSQPGGGLTDEQKRQRGIIHG